MTIPTQAVILLLLGNGGEGAKVKAGKHSVLAIQFWKHDEFVKIVFAEVDGEKIKEDTWYKLDENGEFVEVE